MNISGIMTMLKEALVELAAKAVEELARGIAGWVMERIERLAGVVAERVRGYVQRQRAAGVDEHRLSTRVTDSLLNALDDLRADILRRRETLTAEQALRLFEDQLTMAHLSA